MKIKETPHEETKFFHPQPIPLDEEEVSSDGEERDDDEAYLERHEILEIEEAKRYMIGL